MKKFVISVLVFGVILITAICIAFAIRPIKEEHYFTAINQKIELLDSVSSPRLIFIGGSNVCFGIDSKRISTSIGLPVIDMGLHASIGLKLQLDMVLQKATSNDVLIIMPEIEQFYGILNGEGIILSRVFTLIYPESKPIRLIGTMNASQLSSLISGLPSAIFERYMDKSRPDSAYNSLAFNQYGDNQWHWYMKYNHNIPVNRISKPLDRNAFSYLSEKIDFARAKGIDVILLPPTMIKSFYDLNEDKIKVVSWALSDYGIGFERPADAHVMPDEYGYDTKYHLNKLGVDSLTGLLIDELKEIPNILNLVEN